MTQRAGGISFEMLEVGNHVPTSAMRANRFLTLNTTEVWRLARVFQINCMINLDDRRIKNAGRHCGQCDSPD